jgi:hypothetical protein
MALEVIEAFMPDTGHEKYFLQWHGWAQQSP